MSIHIDDLRDIAANHGWSVCDLAADEIEDLEKSYELLFSENAKLRDVERRLEIRGYELQQERFKAEQHFNVLMGIFNLLNPEMVKLEDGRSMKFVNPHANEILDLLSKRIRAIADDVNNATIRASKEGQP